MFKIVYGIDVDDLSNKYLRLAEEAVEGLADAAVLGRYWVDFLPILKYVPDWLPGTNFKRKADRVRRIAKASKEEPFNAARSAWVSIAFSSTIASFMSLFCSQMTS